MRPQSRHRHCLVWVESQDHPVVASTGTYSRWLRMNGMVAAPCPRTAPCDETKERTKEKMEDLVIFCPSKMFIKMVQTIVFLC